ncbi:MAG TPA: MerR family transcriptional regulator [Propionibacteriaceae bacterium]|nr:MerR family transcriptional regulator [Propionibacteriaceae bacterium]
MRISELSRRSGVSLPTIKYYLREGLLPEGQRTSATQAQYDAEHEARLKLIRALIGTAGLSVAEVRRVLGAIDEPSESVHDLLGVAAGAAARPERSRHPDHERVHALMRQWGWPVAEKDCPNHDALAAALDALDEAGFVLPEGALELYRDHMEQIAEFELSTVPTDSPAAAVRYVVLGTVLPEPLLLALRRLAQQAASARRFG